jgi:hypothetical protein
MAKKPDYNKRLINPEVRKRRKKGEGFVIQNFRIEEIFDESGEVLEDTIIRFSFDGILIHISVANALRFNKLLTDILNLKR